MPLLGGPVEGGRAFHRRSLLALAAAFFAGLWYFSSTVRDGILGCTSPRLKPAIFAFILAFALAFDIRFLTTGIECKPSSLQNVFIKMNY